MSRRPLPPRRVWPAVVAWVAVVAAGVVTTATIDESSIGAAACGACASLASAIALAGMTGPPVPPATSHSPSGPARWHLGSRQCGACGSFSITGPDDEGEGARPIQCSCERCGTTWTAAPGEPWPDIRIRPADPIEEI